MILRAGRKWPTEIVVNLDHCRESVLHIFQSFFGRVAFGDRAPEEEDS